MLHCWSPKHTQTRQRIIYSANRATMTRKVIVVYGQRWMLPSCVRPATLSLPPRSAPSPLSLVLYCSSLSANACSVAIVTALALVHAFVL